VPLSAPAACLGGGYGEVRPRCTNPFGEPTAPVSPLVERLNRVRPEAQEQRPHRFTHPPVAAAYNSLPQGGPSREGASPSGGSVTLASARGQSAAPPSSSSALGCLDRLRQELAEAKDTARELRSINAVKDETALHLAKDELAAVRFAAREEAAAQAAESELAEVKAASELGEWRMAALRAEERQGMLEAELRELRPAWEEELIHVERLANEAVSRSSELASAYSEFRDRSGHDKEGTVLYADRQRRERLDRLEQELQALLPLKMQLPKLQTELAESNGRGRVLKSELEDARQSLQEALDSEAAAARARSKEEPRLRRELEMAKAELDDAQSEQSMLKAKLREQLLHHQQVQQELQAEVEALSLKCLQAPVDDHIAGSVNSAGLVDSSLLPKLEAELVAEAIDEIRKDVVEEIRHQEAIQIESSPVVDHGAWMGSNATMEEWPQVQGDTSAGWPDAGGTGEGVVVEARVEEVSWPQGETDAAWPGLSDATMPHSTWEDTQAVSSDALPNSVSSFPEAAEALPPSSGYEQFEDTVEVVPLSNDALDVSVNLDEVVADDRTEDLMASFMPFGNVEVTELAEGGGLADFMPWATSSPPASSPQVGPSMIPPPPPAELEPGGLTRHSSPVGVNGEGPLQRQPEEELPKGEMEFTATDWEALQLPPDNPAPIGWPEPKLDSPPLPTASVEDKWWEGPSDRQRAAEAAARLVALEAEQNWQEDSDGKSSPTNSLKSYSSTRSPAIAAATSDFPTIPEQHRGDFGVASMPAGRMSSPSSMESPTGAFWAEAFGGPRSSPMHATNSVGGSVFHFSSAPTSQHDAGGYRRRSSTPSAIFTSGNPFAAAPSSVDGFGFSKGNPFAK